MILKRVAYTEHGTFGVLLDGGIPFALTLERPWLNNERNTSCIPVGLFACQRFSSASHKDTFQILDVPARSGILFHTGNIIEHSAGCILIGEEFGLLHKRPAVLSSRKGFDEFMTRLQGQNTFELLIVDASK